MISETLSHLKQSVFLPFFYQAFFQEYSQFSVEQGKGEAIFLTPLYHFHPLHRHLDVSRLVPQSNRERLDSEGMSLTTNLRTQKQCAEIICLARATSDRLTYILLGNKLLDRLNNQGSQKRDMIISLQKIFDHHFEVLSKVTAKAKDFHKLFKMYT